MPLDAADRVECIHVRADPIRQRLGPTRLGVSEVRRAECGDENARLMDLAGRRIDDPDRVARPVDEQLLAGEMRLPHRRRDRSPPRVVQLAEARVAVAVRLLGQILLPQQRERHAATRQLALHLRPVDRRTGAFVADDRKQAPVELDVVEPVRQRPSEARDRGPAHVLRRLRLADAGRLADLAVAQSKGVLQAKHLAHFAHRQSLRRHRLTPLLRGRDQVIRSSMSGAVSRSSPTVRLHRTAVRLASYSLSALRRIPHTVRCLRPLPVRWIAGEVSRIRFSARTPMISETRARYCRAS